VKVTKEKIENSQAYLTVEMEPAEVEDALEHAYEHMVKSTNVPGFRKGKAPRTVLERHVGKEALLEHAINDMIPEAYEKAVKEQNIEPIAQPQLELSQIEPVIFKAVVPLPPTVTLGDYKTIKITSEEVKVEESSIDKVLEQLQHQNATWEPVERPVAFNDMVTVNIKSDVEGKAFVNRDGLQYQVEQGTTFPVAGFAEQLIGINLNEEKEFKLLFPADYSRKEYAAKEVSFKVKVSEIKQEKLPEVNEDFVKTVSSECQDIKTLREKIFEDLKSREAERIKNDFEEKTIQALVDMSKLEYPPVLVDQETNRLLNQQLQYLQASGINVEEYLKNIKKSTDELKEDLKPRAVKRVNQSLVLEKIAEQEKIEVSDEDIEKQIESLVQTYAKEKQDEVRTSFHSDTSRDSIKSALLIMKALQKLVDMAKSTDTEIKSEKEDNI
jgi:trigger factor